MGQGSRADLSLAAGPSRRPILVISWRGSYVCPGAARLNCDSSKKSAFTHSSRVCPPCSEKIPERSGKIDASKVSAQADPSRSYGDPVLERWRPGGSVLAVTDRGRKHTLACRQVAMALANRKQGNRLTSELRIREDERDGREIYESRGNNYPPSAIERGLRQRSAIDGRGSLGQVDGAQGVLTQPEWVRGCEHT